MTFRITPNTMLMRSLQASADRTKTLAQLQQQAATGLRILKPSDDPQAMQATLLAKARQARFDVELNNVRDVRALLDHRVSLLRDANQILARARDVALQAHQADSTAERESLALEVESLLERLFHVANARHGTAFLFGGGESKVPPFAIARGLSPADSREIRYQGLDGRNEVVVSPGRTVPADVSGAEIFQPRSRGDTLILGSTGLAPGTGADNAIGSIRLTVEHVATSFTAGSGVAPGASSPGGDTVIGPPGRHVLRLHDASGDGSSGTISLNGGQAVSFSSADTDLLVEGPEGERVFLDTTAIAPGFSGTIDITADGILSGAEATSPIAIDFSSNQQLHLRDQRVVNLDTTAVRRTGWNHVEFTETAGAFEVLQALRDDLRNTQQWPTADWHQAISRRIGDLERLQEHLPNAIGQQSIQLQHLETLDERIRDLQLQTQQIISEKESADMAQVALRLTNEQTLLQFVYASTRIALDTSLLDFLR
ncbi:MAG: hypothetical protein EA424_11360 [Planctomycetaceae bacterium]|jgi:flagellar hook-associated protein 3 FlgL|nr:MAG: hypothetical protein EA424_11360 [Planctomycetaceae bacterium]